MKKESLNKYKLKVAALFVMMLIALCVFSTSTTFANKETKNILYINSYHMGYQWSDEVYEGLELSILEYEDNVRIIVEHMDSKRYVDEKSRQIFVENMNNKYSSNNIDLIIVSGDAAFNYVQNEGKEIFEGTSFVFCGVSNANTVNVDEHDNYTGVIEMADFARTIEVALELKKDIKNIYYVSDDTFTGEYVVEEFLDIDNNDNYNVLKVPGETLEEVFENIEQLDNESIVVFIEFFKKNGVFYNHDEIYPYLRKVDNVAVFGNQVYYLNNGLLGGYMSSGFDHGYSAGEMAGQILGGKLPKDIDIIGKGFNKLWFNFDELNEQGIDIGQLPKNAMLSNYKAYGVKNISVLHSYSSTSYSSAEFERGIRDFLKENEYEFKLISEYLDADKASDVNYFNKYFDYLSDKYDKIAIDAVVAYRAPSYEFITKYNALAADNDFVYAFTEDELNKINGDVSKQGVIGEQNITSNINLAMTLNPNLKKIMIITDNTETGQRYKESVEQFEEQYKGKLIFSYLNDLSIEEISDTVSWLENDSAIFFMHFSRDSQNKIFLENDSFERIYKSSTAPIYTLRDDYIGKGALGGRVDSAYKTGRIVGEKLVNVFSGKRFDEPYLNGMDTTAYIFDHDQIQKYNIDTSLLPKDSIIENEPKSLRVLIEKNPLVTTLVITIFISALIIISLLFAYIRYKAKVQKRIHFLAIKDEMTDTYNRRYAYELLEKLMKEVNEKYSLFTLCFIDINGLKETNDDIGHAQGDKLIVATCDVIKKNIREGDFIARIGGDEFLLVMPSTSINEGKSVLKRIQNEIDEINENGVNKFKISFSKGFSEYSFDSPIDVEKLINLADEEMFNDKENSKVSKPSAPENTSDKVIYLNIDKK